MPVYHKRLVTPEIKGELYHGPIDGVKPENHWNTYYYLRRLRCSYTYRGPIFQHLRDRGEIYCYECFSLVQDANRFQYISIVQHGLIHEREAYLSRKCKNCNNTVLKIKPAYNCLGCIEEYLNVDRASLDLGSRVPVVQRWLEMLEFKSNSNQ